MSDFLPFSRGNGAFYLENFVTQKFYRVKPYRGQLMNTIVEGNVFCATYNLKDSKLIVSKKLPHRSRPSWAPLFFAGKDSVGRYLDHAN